MATKPSSKLSVIIVGAGIAGLAAATSISQKGHKVTVLEAKPALDEFGASIGILANGVRPLKAWGLEAKFAPVVTKNQFLEIRDAKSNNVLGRMAHNHKKKGEISYGEEIWNIHRADYQQVLAKAAKENGANIMFNANALRVDVEQCRVVLEDGRELKADVIVGADGMRSAVRHSIPALSGVGPQSFLEQCFRCTVPKERMANHPRLDWLLRSGNEMCWTAPGKYVLTWPLPEDRPYDVVCCVVRESQLPAGRWGIKADGEAIRKEFEDFCPEVTELLSMIDQSVQWMLADLPPLSTFRSDNGRIVLMGDACHAMIPHSASGGNSAIEDAAVLAECFDWAHRNGQPVCKATEAYQNLRKPRVERMQTASHEGYGFLSAGGEFKAIRDQALADQTRAEEDELAMDESERRAMPSAPKDMRARFPSPSYLQWLYGYDAIVESKKYLDELE